MLFALGVSGLICLIWFCAGDKRDFAVIVRKTSVFPRGCGHIERRHESDRHVSCASVAVGVGLSRYIGRRADPFHFGVRRIFQRKNTVVAMGRNGLRRRRNDFIVNLNRRGFVWIKFFRRQNGYGLRKAASINTPILSIRLLRNRAAPSGLYISADSNYAVYINGKLLYAGQYPDYPDYKVYDVFDIASY